MKHPSMVAPPLHPLLGNLNAQNFVSTLARTQMTPEGSYSPHHTKTIVSLLTRSRTRVRTITKTNIEAVIKIGMLERNHDGNHCNGHY